jgi:uncharacterized protein
MSGNRLHRFELDDHRYVIDPETCFCFECDAISWDVLELFPHTPNNAILHQLSDTHPLDELKEVVGELEWLRSSKSILPVRTPEEEAKQFEVEQGLKRITCRLEKQDTAPVVKARNPWFRAKDKTEEYDSIQLARDAALLLFARSGLQQRLTLEFVVTQKWLQGNRPTLATVTLEAFKQASLAHKTLKVVVAVEEMMPPDAPESLQGHDLVVKLDLTSPDDVQPHLDALLQTAGKWSRWKKNLAKASDKAGWRAVLTPGHPDFASGLEVLQHVGFKHIEIDMDNAFVVHPEHDPALLMKGLETAAQCYAQELLNHNYYRLDPIATLFLRIYEGKPLAKSDPAGVNELAIDWDGLIYPSWQFLGREACCAGDLRAGQLDEEALKAFEDVGALTTNPCTTCWAGNLCGGGTAAVHAVQTGSFRQPHVPWCDAQRSWLQSMVASFNILTAQGVHFSRVYQSLGKKQKVSFFSLARAAFRMQVGIRPLAEGDAELLTQWENWNEAAYFTFTPHTMFMATRYDREMDSLHPRGDEQEFILLSKNGGAMGLLKIKPGPWHETAQAAIYFHNATDYASPVVQRSFRSIIAESLRSRGIRRVTVAVGPNEEPLASFLEALGAREEGQIREALFLHGRYHAVRVFGLTL